MAIKHLHKTVAYGETPEQKKKRLDRIAELKKSISEKTKEKNKTDKYALKYHHLSDDIAVMRKKVQKLMRGQAE